MVRVVTKEVVYGFISVNSASATVLFDPRASHSFISSAYVKEHEIAMLPIRRPVIVKTPEGEMKQTANAQELVLTSKE